jgi:hypothetical protein
MSQDAFAFTKLVVEGRSNRVSELVRVVINTIVTDHLVKIRCAEYDPTYMKSQ